MKIKNRFFYLCLLASFLLNCAGGAGSRATGSSTRGDYGNRSAGPKRCNIDIECGVQSRCVEGVCTGGITPEISGKCVTGNYGRRVCSNSGKACTVDAECIGP